MSSKDKQEPQSIFPGKDRNIPPKGIEKHLEKLWTWIADNVTDPEVLTDEIEKARELIREKYGVQITYLDRELPRDYIAHFKYACGGQWKEGESKEILKGMAMIYKVFHNRYLEHFIRDEIRQVHMFKDFVDCENGKTWGESLIGEKFFWLDIDRLMHADGESTVHHEIGHTFARTAVESFAQAWAFHFHPENIRIVEENPGLKEYMTRQADFYEKKIKKLSASVSCEHSESRRQSDGRGHQ